MKKILIALACATLISAVASISDSCSPTAPNDTAIPITLNSVPGGLTLTRTNISQSASVGLSCGCAFPLSVTGYGGDTALIHFIVWEVPDSSTHTVNASVDPASLPAGPDKIPRGLALPPRTTARSRIQARHFTTPCAHTWLISIEETDIVLL